MTNGRGERLGYPFEFGAFRFKFGRGAENPAGGSEWKLELAEVVEDNIASAAL